MALFHFTVTQTKRSKGQSAIASAAYRAGERLYSEYYGEYSDYTRKGGVICSDILLPSHAPPEYADRQTLWNAVEKAERGKNAQLAYSFDSALQNEFSLEENIALARRFLLENFVSRGMVVDFAVHQPDREDGGIPMLHKCWTGAYCRYFREAVLPLDPELQAALTTEGISSELRACAVCGKAFLPEGRQAYCSDVCKAEGNRRKSRERMRKMREKRPGGCYDLPPPKA